MNSIVTAATCCIGVCSQCETRVLLYIAHIQGILPFRHPNFLSCYGTTPTITLVALLQVCFRYKKITVSDTAQYTVQ